MSTHQHTFDLDLLDEEQRLYEAVVEEAARLASPLHHLGRVRPAGRVSAHQVTVERGQGLGQLEERVKVRSPGRSRGVSETGVAGRGGSRSGHQVTEQWWQELMQNDRSQ